MNKREVTCFVLKEESALTPAACDPMRAWCSHTFVMVLSCALQYKSNVFCFRAAVEGG